MDWSLSRNVDIKKLLQSLLDNKVQFLVIGAWALPAHGYERMTGDVDIFIKPTEQNAQRTIKALRAIGYRAIDEVTVPLLLSKKVLLRQYVLQTDIHSFVIGVRFEEAWKKRIKTEIKGVEVFVPSLDTLIAMKKAAGRPKDREDLRVLEKIREKKKRTNKKATWPS